MKIWAVATIIVFCWKAALALFFILSRGDERIDPIYSSSMLGTKREEHIRTVEDAGEGKTAA